MSTSATTVQPATDTQIWDEVNRLRAERGLPAPRSVQLFHPKDRHIPPILVITLKDSFDAGAWCKAYNVGCVQETGPDKYGARNVDYLVWHGWATQIHSVSC
jgi:hypothetical protein